MSALASAITNLETGWISASSGHAYDFEISLSRRQVLEYVQFLRVPQRQNAISVPVRRVSTCMVIAMKYLHRKRLVTFLQTSRSEVLETVDVLSEVHLRTFSRSETEGGNVSCKGGVLSKTTVE